MSAEEHTGMGRMAFYVVSKAGQFFIKETKEPFHQSAIDAFQEQGWELHGPFPSRRQAKDKVHDLFRLSQKGNEGDRSTGGAQA